MSVLKFSAALGQLASIYGEFRDEAGALKDPASVSIKRKTPLGVSNTYTRPSAGPDNQVVRVSQGKYRYQQSLDEVGPYILKWQSTGDGQAATPDFEIDVARTVFP